MAVYNIWIKYLSVAEIAKQWNMSERSVRYYCAQGKIDGAFLTGKTWTEDLSKSWRLFTVLLICGRVVFRLCKRLV